jgi:Glutamine amidotransferase domain
MNARLRALHNNFEWIANMCGLAGEIACAAHGRADADRAVPMLQAILHRGPDDVGLWDDETGEACLFHARLALVDFNGGKQPMTNFGEDVVIAFNGEIYGFERIRRDLETRGVVFRTRSDTEVLLQLYLRFGPDFVRGLEGEFAFVLVDRRNGQTMLARDRFGIKPLFTSVRNGLRRSWPIRGPSGNSTWRHSTASFTESSCRRIPCSPASRRSSPAPICWSLAAGSRRAGTMRWSRKRRAPRG